MLETIVKRTAGLLIILICLGAPINFAGVEETRNLGFGFHLDVIAEPSTNSLESVGHFEYLFYRKHKLSQVNKFAVAPSGQAVVYQDGPSGNIFVFDTQRQRTMRLTSSFPGLVDNFIWHESDNYIMALINTKGLPRWLKLVRAKEK